MSIASLLLLLLSGSCSREEFIDGRGLKNGRATLSLSFATRAPGDDPESVMNSLRIIIFDSNVSGIESGVPLVNVKYDIPAGATRVDISEVVPVGYVNIYLIGNESEAMNLNAVTSSGDFDGIVMDHAGAGRNYIQYPFLMYSAYRAVDIDVDGVLTHPQVIKSGGRATFPIERTAAKITVNLDCDFADLGGRAIALDSARIVSMPKSSWLISREYAEVDGGDYFTSDDMGTSIDFSQGVYFEQKMENSDVVGFSTVEGGFKFYIPEHIINDADRSHYTWLNIVGHPLNSPGTRLTYRIPLGNGLFIDYDSAYLAENYATVPSSALSITRSTHYILDLAIEGFGENYGIEVNVAVEPWRGIYIDGTTESAYLNVSSVTASVFWYSVLQRIYFWTNSDDVHIEEQGKVGSSSGPDFTVDSIFTDLTGAGATNFHYNPSTGTGYFDIQIDTSAGNFPQTRYLIYLTAGKLRREIEIYANNNPVD